MARMYLGRGHLELLHSCIATRLHRMEDLMVMLLTCLTDRTSW